MWPTAWECEERLAQTVSLPKGVQHCYEESVIKKVGYRGKSYYYCYMSDGGVKQGIFSLDA